MKKIEGAFVFAGTFCAVEKSASYEQKNLRKGKTREIW
jgi:hypothetical protein